MDLTIQEQAYLKYIDGYIKEHGKSPTHAEIATEFDKSGSMGFKIVQKLKEKGAIKTIAGSNRNIIVL